jgi:hypothetical protein
LVYDEDSERVRMIFSPTSRLVSREDAQLSGMLNRYLHWQELLSYKARGIKFYDFGGIGDGSSTIARFKLSFGGFRAQDYSYVFSGALGVVGYKLHDLLSQYRIKRIFKA